MGDELNKGLLVRNEVEGVVLFELSVRKTLERRPVWMQGSSASFPNQRVHFLLGTDATAHGLMSSLVAFLLIKCIIIEQPAKR
jgi:hypothetical protein